MSDATPLVSIVIPVYNGETYLSQAIDSALAQTFSDIEVIVVNDGSVDDTPQIIHSYGERIQGIHKENGGVATSLNAGIRAAQGRYIAWLSHDDLFVPDKLEVQLTALEDQPEWVGVYSDYEVIDAEGAIISLVRCPWYQPEATLRRLLQSLYINGSTLLVERQALLDVGLFDESVRIGNDALMWFALGHDYRLGYVPQPLTHYRVHRSQTSQDWMAMKRDFIQWVTICMKRYTLDDFFPELSRRAGNKMDRVLAHLHLGDILLYNHLLYVLAQRQYRLAWKAWPNWRNPALRSMVKGVIHILRRRSANMIRRINRVLFVRQAVQPLFPAGEWDMRGWTERIPEPDFVDR